ncbi:hypothetical protein EDF51_105133 [Curtobacterium sp. PhB25]|uniref:hypothetical protein n=1 Tax=unclassified Curtobacterium TaxID=257496 RepID=UPI001046F49F|nr:MULTISPECIES: hypothetical protein [unclassified Curtobacterium]TCU85284.1 hypothetical protein EDF48_104157 [Curtobacterium sp. PhB191]TDW46800.1 hypothetical protein EDF52_10793 [Curtobacterium sp. PhB42]TDW57124.1 hypothetical protein EDF47_10293 [Curtobacterium sp. PhB190]TDW71632.1 hypothetical protein EDF51_105133 [Curtobacterium sp. PhB25]
MRTASKISQCDQWFIDPADVLVSHRNADSSSSKGIEHRPVAVISCPAARTSTRAASQADAVMTTAAMTYVV